MEEWIKVLIQGIVQGITEFLPISSTGHLLIVSNLLNFEVDQTGTFEIFIQIGTLVSVIGLYRNAIWQQIRTFPSDGAVRAFWYKVILASIPIAVTGFLLLDFIMEDLLGNPSALTVTIAITLIVGGVIFLWIEHHPTFSQTDTEERIYEITYLQALWVGIAQMFALIPGTSRSGATIVGALLTGLNRRTATVFSFYLAMPALGGATVLTLLFNLEDLQFDGLAYLLVGAVVSGVVAWFAIEWLLDFVSRHTFIAFGYYRIVAGLLLFVLLGLGIL